MSTRNEKAQQLMKEAEKKHKAKPKAPARVLGDAWVLFNELYREKYHISYNTNKQAAFKTLKELLLGINSDIEGMLAVIREYVENYDKKYASQTYNAPSIMGMKYRFNEIYLALQKQAKKSQAKKQPDQEPSSGGVQWL